MNIVLKDLEIKDWKQIKKVAESSWNFTYGKILSQETIDKYIKSNYSREATQQAIEWAKKNNGKHFVAKIDNKIIGFATVGPDKDGWRLWRIYLSPEYIRKGIGLMILKNCERFLKKQNAKKYFCYVHQKNEIGKKFYLKSGFKHTADKDKEIEWYMEKSL